MQNSRGFPRVGVGYDIHRLAEERRLVLGGVEIPHDRGLDGHSDADVLLHAVMDALLGAAGMGDIGHHFPPGDPDYKDISSLVLLQRVTSLIRQLGYTIGNVDATVVAEQPKLAPHIPLMRQRMAEALGVAGEQVGIKATTNEGLGPLGAGQGIAAWAVALIVPWTQLP
jgi:2-C-methyl-D-erythritol 2,4-cyclodiphosphate synthase